MAKPNYAFEKRQRELEKKRKKEEKAQRKTVAPVPSADDAQGVNATPDAATTAPEPGR